MAFFFLLIYGALGAAAGWIGLSYGGLELPVAIGAGVSTGLILAQAHLFMFRGQKRIEDLEDMVLPLKNDLADTGERMDVLVARTDAIETTLKHELTERRDALVSEMQQLEGLIDRLSRSFEQRRDGTPAQDGPKSHDPVLRDVKEALYEGRVDLYLQPAVSLPQRRVAFYEGFTRLRRADGSLILPGEFLDAARRAGLLGFIDNMTLFRCVQIVRRLSARDRRVGVFCNIAALSLEDDKFFPKFLAFMTENDDLAGSLIFEIRADRFETRSRVMRERMDKLTALGFRFSLDHAADLDLDLPRLQSAGIRFVKMNGQTLLENLRSPSGPRPISTMERRPEGRDVSALFARHGMTLIAEKLEDEASVVEILDYNIPYGQGHIFGAPRPIKNSLMEETAPPAEFLRELRASG